MIRKCVAATAIAASVALAGCQTANVTNKENLLSAAGFIPKPADTPEKIAKLKSFPPHKFTQLTQNGQIV